MMYGPFRVASSLALLGGRSPFYSDLLVRSPVTLQETNPSAPVWRLLVYGAWYERER
jgi:hypothetical protein